MAPVSTSTDWVTILVTAAISSLFSGGAVFLAIKGWLRSIIHDELETSSIINQKVQKELEKSAIIVAINKDLDEIKVSLGKLSDLFITMAKIEAAITYVKEELDRNKK